MHKSGEVPHLWGMSLRNSALSTTYTGASSQAQHPVAPPQWGVAVSENAIEDFGPDSLSLWVYYALRCGNRVIYPWSETSREKLGISRPTFYRHIGKMSKVGLCREVKTKSGVQWRLLRRDDLRSVRGTPTKHRCTIVLDRRASLQEVKDAVTLKLVERAHRQVEWAMGPKKESIKRRIKRERAEALCPLQHQYRSALKVHSFLGLLSEEREITLKRVHAGYCPMNTEKLMRETGKGRDALYAWKIRARDRGWIDWVRRDHDIGPDLYEHCMNTGKEFCERFARGKFSANSSGFYFHQAACYKLNSTYGQTQAREPKY